MTGWYLWMGFLGLFALYLLVSFVAGVVKGVLDAMKWSVARHVPTAPTITTVTDDCLIIRNFGSEDWRNELDDPDDRRHLH